MTFTKLSSNLIEALERTNNIFDLDTLSIEIANLIIEASTNNKITTIFGNGGSAADAQHWAAELTCTYKKVGRKPYLAQALTTDTSILTAWSNDVEFTSVFSRQIEALGSLNGLAIGISTSGRSPNILHALNTASFLNVRTILISGSGADKFNFIDHHIRFQTEETSIIQTLTQMFYHSVCEVLEEL